VPFAPLKFQLALRVGSFSPIVMLSTPSMIAVTVSPISSVTALWMLASPTVLPGGSESSASPISPFAALWVLVSPTLLQGVVLTDSKNVVMYSVVSFAPLKSRVDLRRHQLFFT